MQCINKRIYFIFQFFLAPKNESIFQPESIQQKNIRVANALKKILDMKRSYDFDFGGTKVILAVKINCIRFIFTKGEKRWSGTSKSTVWISL